MFISQEGLRDPHFCWILIDHVWVVGYLFRNIFFLIILSPKIFFIFSQRKFFSCVLRYFIRMLKERKSNMQDEWPKIKVKKKHSLLYSINRNGHWTLFRIFMHMCWNIENDDGWQKVNIENELKNSFSWKLTVWCVDLLLSIFSIFQKINQEIFNK